MATETEMSVEDKVDQLMKIKWSPLNDSRPDGVLSGICVVGQSTILDSKEDPQPQYLYLGRSNNTSRKLNEFFQMEDREIVKYLRGQYREDCGNTPMVKWIEEPDHEFLKREYLKKLEAKLGYDLA